MSDEPASPLVKELRERPMKSDYAKALMLRAADEIERLQHDLTKAMQNHAADATEMEQDACDRANDQFDRSHT